MKYKGILKTQTVPSMCQAGWTNNEAVWGMRREIITVETEDFAKC